jgi:YD repeat-containing protein
VTGGHVTDFVRGNLEGTFEQQFDYDGLGRLIWHTDDNGDLPVTGALQYDVRGLVLNETLDVARPSGSGVMSRTVSHEYDAAGMVEKMTYPAA